MRRLAFLFAACVAAAHHPSRVSSDSELSAMTEVPELRIPTELRGLLVPTESSTLTTKRPRPPDIGPWEPAEPFTSSVSTESSTLTTPGTEPPAMSGIRDPFEPNKPSTFSASTESLTPVPSSHSTTALTASSSTAISNDHSSIEDDIRTPTASSDKTLSTGISSTNITPIGTLSRSTNTVSESSLQTSSNTESPSHSSTTAEHTSSVHSTHSEVNTPGTTIQTRITASSGSSSNTPQTLITPSSSTSLASPTPSSTTLESESSISPTTSTSSPAASTSVSSGASPTAPDTSSETRISTEIPINPTSDTVHTSSVTSTSDGTIPPTTTFTTLPPEATTEQITQGTFSSDTFITTTVKDGSEPTVVPIILPPKGGPPVVCLNCLPPGPGPHNVIIDIPGPEGFCIQILGTKIGKCPDDPPSEATGTATKQPDETTKVEPTTDHSVTEPPTTTSSCETSTATITSVVCATDSTTTSCTTITTEILGCSVTNTATTRTTCTLSNCDPVTFTEIEESPDGFVLDDEYIPLEELSSIWYSLHPSDKPTTMLETSATMTPSVRSTITGATSTSETTSQTTFKTISKATPKITSEATSSTPSPSPTLMEFTLRRWYLHESDCSESGTMDIDYFIGGGQTDYTFFKKPDSGPIRFTLPAEPHSDADWEFRVPTNEEGVDLIDFAKSWSVKREDNEEEIKHSDEASLTKIKWRAPDSYEKGFIIDLVVTTSESFTVQPVAVGSKQVTCEPPPPPPPENDHPDPSKNDAYCYPEGRKSDYDAIVYAARDFCDDLRNEPSAPYFGPGFKKEGKKSPVGNYHFILEFEIFDGCDWIFSYKECVQYFKVPIDSCDCSGVNGKQGGTLTNNCLTLRIDPNSGL